MTVHSTICILQSIGVIVLPILAVTQVSPGVIMKKEDAREWGKAIEGQAISIAADKSKYFPGERILLNISFKNVGRHDVRMVIMTLLGTYQIAPSFRSDKHVEDVPLTLYGRRELEVSKIGGSRCCLNVHPRGFRGHKLIVAYWARGEKRDRSD